MKTITTTTIETPAAGIRIVKINCAAIPGSATAGVAYDAVIDDHETYGHWSADHYSTPELAREKAARIVAKAKAK